MKVKVILLEWLKFHVKIKKITSNNFIAKTA